MARAQSLLNYRHILREELVNRTDWALEDIWDKPAPQQLLWISVFIVSSYLWISAWIAFWIAYISNQFLVISYGINLFLGIIYGVNLFLEIVYCVNLFVIIIICRIVNCLLDRTSLDFFYCFLQECLKQFVSRMSCLHLSFVH